MEANEHAFYGGWGGWGRRGWGGPRRWGWGGPGPWGYGGYRRRFHRRAYCCPLVLFMMVAAAMGMLLGTFSLARLFRRPAR
jgi:hypothetical protein